jgi:hypothetical protein
MRISVLFTFLLTMIIFRMSAQDNALVSGYIVMLNKDTIHGLILDKTDTDLRELVFFKKNAADSLKSFSSTQLLGFGFENGRIFEKFAYIINKQDTIRVFAKRLIKGKIDAFELKPLKGGDPMFFLVNNSTGRKVQLEPPVQEVVTDKSGKQVVVEYRRYLMALSTVKANSTSNVAPESDFRYSRRRILQNITTYNTAFQPEFPLKKYTERKTVSYDFSLGSPMAFDRMKNEFRLAVYRNLRYPEDSRSFSFFMGISYRYYSDPTSAVISHRDGFDTKHAHFLSFIPAGMQFQRKSGLIKPYFYGGMGLMLNMETIQKIEDFQPAGIENYSKFFLAVNIGTGLKFKINKHNFFVEVTPAILFSGFFLNVGYSL